MLIWALLFFAIAVLSALVGFSGVADGSGVLAKVVFLGFLVLAVLTFVVQAARRT